MELVITALFTLLDQAGELVKLWQSLGETPLTKEEISAKIESILSWENTSNKEEWDELAARIKKNKEAAAEAANAAIAAGSNSTPSKP